jgi:tight adherence protein C
MAKMPERNSTTSGHQARQLSSYTTGRAELVDHQTKSQMQFIFNNSIFEQHGLVIAGVISLFAVAWAVATILQVLFFRASDALEHPFEIQRRNELREGSLLYRWLEPLIIDIEKWVRRRDGKTLTKIETSLVQSGETLPWRASEFCATKFVEGGVVAVSIFVFVSLVQSRDIALGAALLTLASYGFLAEQSLLKKAGLRAKILKQRLPYAVDLLALMIGAGAGFQESLETFVNEGKGHPLADEFETVLKQIELGRPRHEALAALKARVKDDDVAELVFAINKGDELGTPITVILSDQADQMRMKRSQWGEKAAAEAGVKVIFPGMFIVVACLLVVLAPFALPILDALK